MLAHIDKSSSTALLPRGVRRAFEAMRENVGRDWSVAELAAGAGVSRRTLQRQFRTFLGKSPHLTLRDLRFDSARRELLQSLPDAKVMDVALRCGFAHFGRFSIEYRRRYSESPSETLRRQATLAGVLASMPSFFASNRDGLTIAVDPIEAGPEDCAIARSIGEELTTALARTGVVVVSQPRAARYRLYGAIRGWYRQSRLTLRLTETETGRHLWAHRSNGALGDDAAPGEHLATRIVASLQPSLRLAEIDRAQQKPDGELSPHDLTLRALPGVLSLEPDGNARALDLLERAIDRDPDDALAYALAAWARVQRVVYHFSATLAEERALSAQLALRAQARAGDATVLAVLGNAFALLRDLPTANLVVRKALALDGGSAWAWSRQGWIDVYGGDPESAIERFKIALDLAPQDSLAFNSLVGIGCAHFKAGRYLESARWQERALLERPSAIWVHRTLCPAYELSGARSDARRSLDALLHRHPGLTVAEVERGLPPLPRSYCDQLFGALHSVGLPL